MGYQPEATDGNLTRYRLPNGNGADIIDLESLPGAAAARQGGGSVHHIAFSVPDRASQDQVRKATLDRLYDRRDKTGGNFSEDWIQEEAAKAAEEVARSYATVIGDLDSLGRAPETVSEMDTITSKPPVAAPEFKKGMDRGTVDTAIREFNTDALTRLAVDVSAGGDTKA